MPVPEAQAATEGFRRRLLQLDRDAARELIRAYGPIWTRLQDQIESLMEEVTDKQMSFAQMQRLERYQSLQRQVSREIATYNGIANGRISDAQRAAAELSRQGARRIVDAALPRGITTQLLAQAGIQWNTLPTAAFESFIGIAGNGQPLSTLLAPLGASAQAGIIQGLSEGIALGKGPRETARLVRKHFGMPLTRALTISRTETLRAFREGTRMQYAANPEVVRGYQRLSAKDSGVCMACIALDGNTYQTSELMELHPNDRCSMVPITVSYADLGLDVPDDTTPVETSRDWFQQQSETTQRQMMGHTRFEAWQAGQFELTEMAKITHHDIWGDSATVKPLKELLNVASD